MTWFDLPSNEKGPTSCQSFCTKLVGKNETARNVLSKLIWVISTARNAIIVVTCTVMAYGLDPEIPEGEENKRNTTFILTGNIKAGLPEFQPPPFSFNDTEKNVTYNFGEMVSELGAAIAILPLLAILGNVAIAKAFCK